MKNASDFQGLYDDLFDFANAGYVMIDVSNPLDNAAPEFEDWAYTSPDPKKFWMTGVADKWHVTARGPLDPKVRRFHCDTVLKQTFLPGEFLTGFAEVFKSPYPEEQYDCLVLHIRDEELYNINEQLAILPGVQTYVTYQPHVTIGYFKPGHTEELIGLANEMARPFVKVLGLDYGRMAP